MEKIGNHHGFYRESAKTLSGYDTIWKIVDRLTKYAHLLPLKETDNMEKLTRLYLKEVLSDESLVISLVDNQIDDKLHFVGEPVGIMEREVNVCNVLVWVKFYDVPITAYTEDELSAIATKLVQSNKKTEKAPRKSKVTKANDDAIFHTTLKSFQALSIMVDVEEEGEQVEKSYSEVEDIDGDTARFMASLSNRAGGGANDASLLEDEDYGIYDGYNDDAYDLSEKQLVLCKAFNITLRSRVRK
nr:reverse transcriptase domain-containing protein [Tanacetum cinerariifolium]